MANVQVSQSAEGTSAATHSWALLPRRTMKYAKHLVWLYPVAVVAIEWWFVFRPLIAWCGRNPGVCF